MVMVKAVLRVTCLHFELSVLGLNFFYSLLQEGGGNKYLKKILSKPNVFRALGHEAVFTTRIRKNDFLEDMVLQSWCYGSFL